MKQDKHRPSGRLMSDNPAFDMPALRFWEFVDRDEIEVAMLDHPEKFEHFLAMLHEPAYARCSVPYIMRKANVSLHELQVLYTDHKRQLGLMKMSCDLPQVMADVTEDAKSKLGLCPRCDGTKVVGKGKKERPCPLCEGVGQVKTIGDKHARDLVFESMGLVKQPGGPLIAIQQNIGAVGGLDARIEDLLKLTQSITMGGTDGGKQ